MFTLALCVLWFFFFSSRRRHTRFDCDWSSDVCSSDLATAVEDRDLVAAAQRRLHQVPAEEDRAAEDEESHRGPPGYRLSRNPDQTAGGEIGRASCRERV